MSGEMRCAESRILSGACVPTKGIMGNCATGGRHWPEYDSQAGYLEFAGGAALNISQQKNDGRRNGAHKRFGKSNDPSLDFMAQMADFHAAAGMAVGPQCLKRLRPAERCRYCQPRLPRATRD